MSFKYKSILSLFLLATIGIPRPNEVSAQCGTTTTSGANCNRSGFYYGEILPNNGCANFNSGTGYGPGLYFRMPVLQGGCYTVSTCGEVADLQLSAFEGAATVNPFSYNDNNGPDCSGIQASIIMTPSFTDYANIDVRETSCLPGGTASITVKVRQNNNLAFTSASTDMCQGQVRALTATPARVIVSPQTGSGDVGTFSGTGVSGTNFTAPTPVGASAIYTQSYSFGYCSTSQTITVFRNGTLANAGSPQTICAATATLAGNAPTYGTGTWTVVSGTANITSPNSPTSTVTGIPVGTSATLQWTISNGPCAPSSSTVVITRNTAPSAPNAGPDQNICSNSVTLTAATPTVGTGAWSLLGGSGTILTPNNPSTTVNNLGIGANTFIWSVSNGVCTPVTDTVVIIRAAAPTPAAAGPNQSICDSSTTLAGNPPTAGTGVWAVLSGSANITTPSNPNTTLTNIPVGTTTLTWSISSGSCAASVDTVVITRNAPPAAPSVTGSTSICPGSSAVLTASSSATSPNYSWWNAPVGGSSLSATALYNTPTLTSNANYWVQVTDGGSNCTSARTQVSITVLPDPNPSLGADTTFCNNDTLCLSPGAQYTNYLWSNGSAGSTHCVTTPGMVWVLVTDGNGCQGGDSIQIATRPAPIVSLGPDLTFCAGSSSNIGVNPVSGVSYLWSTGGTTSMISINAAGNYVLTATDGFGCSGSDDVNATLTPLPVGNFTTDLSNCPNVAFSNLSTNAAGWIWSFGDGSATTSLQNPTHNYQAAGNGTYNVTLYAMSSCGSDTVVIPVIINCVGVGTVDAQNISVMVYPNPSNGNFKVQFQGLEADAVMSLYNAAGQKVYARDLSGMRGTFVEEVGLQAAAGIYLLKLQVEGQEITRRIVIE